MREPHPRATVHYWKCDRPAAFFGLHGHAPDHGGTELASLVAQALSRHFGERVALDPGGSQGNHATFAATIRGRPCFVRVEDGPDGDDYLEVEAHVLREVARCGTPAPEVIAVDATRREAPFAWQVLERVPHADLNSHLKAGRLDMPAIATQIGAHVARWQAVAVAGFGPFSIAALRAGQGLRGYHAAYADYFRLRLDEHLNFLVRENFLPREVAWEIRREVEVHAALLSRPAACLAHKDLALWNILGEPGRIAAFIDFDDAIGGDPMDDLSLLGCFHGGPVVARALEGYATVRPWPDDHGRRFWLHLLRNMIFKAVIRVGAGYFDRTSGFFLIGSGASGADLRAFTLARLDTALRGLRDDAPIGSLA